MSKNQKWLPKRITNYYQQFIMFLYFIPSRVTEMAYGFILNWYN